MFRWWLILRSQIRVRLGCTDECIDLSTEAPGHHLIHRVRLESCALIDAQQIDSTIRQFAHPRQRVQAAQTVRKVHLTHAKVFANHVHSLFC